MKVADMFPRKYVSGEDLQGKPFTLVIAKVQPERMRPNASAPEETKYVVYFQEAQKGLILNRTLATQIAEITGQDDTDHWKGKRVTIFPQPMTVAGQARIAIRARRPQQLATDTPPETLQQDEDEEI